MSSWGYVAVGSNVQKVPTPTICIPNQLCGIWNRIYELCLLPLVDSAFPLKACKATNFTRLLTYRNWCTDIESMHNIHVLCCFVQVCRTSLDTQNMTRRTTLAQSRPHHSRPGLRIDLQPHRRPLAASFRPFALHAKNNGLRGFGVRDAPCCRCPLRPAKRNSLVVVRVVGGAAAVGKAATDSLAAALSAADMPLWLLGVRYA